MSELQFKGYAVHDTKKWSEFKLIDFESKRFEDYDVEVKIDYCGVCGSDVHTITGGWGKPTLPVIPGHEIVGIVQRVGPKVSEFKKGDRVGVGAQVGACLKCTNCKNDNENYCIEGNIDTYNAKYPNGDIAHGGYSTGIRAHERFVFPIPEQIENEAAGPLFCAGLTVFSPLVRYNTGPGKSVGIVGMGGLGHLAVQFAKALGADKVVVFSHSDRKREDAFKFGATDFVVTGAGPDAFTPWSFQLDLIISTVDVAGGFPLADLVGTLGVNGHLITVGLPDDPLPPFKASGFTKNGASIGGSHIGSKKEALLMLKIAAEKNVRPLVQVLPMSKAGEAVTKVKNGDVHYRYVLKADI